MSRCRDRAGIDPYEWALAAVDERADVLDLACGSAPTYHPRTGRWIGIDRSPAELALATERGAHPLAAADAGAVPLRSAGLDVVLCTMGLMLLEPFDRVLDEVARLLRPTGLLIALLPATKPLHLHDRARYVRLLTALRHRLAYPNDRRLSKPNSTLGRAGLHLREDHAQRFELAIESDEFASLFVRSIYLPGVTDDRLQAAIAVVRRWVGSSIGLPLRRIVAERRTGPGDR